MKPLLGCNFAVLRFRPYRETGEFVNLGVVLFCPATRYFDFKLETERSKRVTDFFPELVRSSFAETRARFGNELQRIKSMLADTERTPVEAELAGVFRELVRPRESVMHFGEVGTVLTEDPAGKLAELFRRHVNRQSTQANEYQEA